MIIWGRVGPRGRRSCYTGDRVAQAREALEPIRQEQQACHEEEIHPSEQSQQAQQNILSHGLLMKGLDLSTRYAVESELLDCIAA